MTASIAVPNMLMLNVANSCVLIESKTNESGTASQRLIILIVIHSHGYPKGTSL